MLRYQLKSSKGENIREGVLSASGGAGTGRPFYGAIDPPLEPNADDFYVVSVSAPSRGRSPRASGTLAR